MGKPRFAKCRKVERQVLEGALKQVRGLVSGDTFAALGLDGLRKKILDRLDGKRPLRVECREGGDRSRLVEVKDLDEGEIEINRTAFLLGEGRIAAALLGALVRIGGGFILDAEALQHHCFPGVGEQPGPESRSRFQKRPQIDGMHAGRFVLWNPLTGELFARQGSGEAVVAGHRLRPTFGAPQEIHAVAAVVPEEAAAEPAAVAPEPEEAATALATAEPEADSDPEEEEPDDDEAEDEPEDPAMEMDWFQAPLSVQALMAGLQVPPEAMGLIQEMMETGSRFPGEWADIVEEMTRFLLDKSGALEAD